MTSKLFLSAGLLTWCMLGAAPLGGMVWAQSAAAVSEAQIDQARGRLQALTAELKATRADVRKMTRARGASPFQSRSVLGGLRDQLNAAKAELTPFAKSDDPDVKAALRAFRGLSDTMVAEYNRAKKQRDQVGDPAKRLADLEKAVSNSAAAPDPLQPPYSPERISVWAEAAASARAGVDKTRKQAQRWIGLLYESEMFKAIDAAEAERAQALKDRGAALIKTIMREFPEDPTDGRILRGFIDANDPGGAYGLLDRNAQMAALARDVSGAVALDPTRYVKLLERIAAARADFEKDFATGRLPEPKSIDPQRLAIAQKILATPKYGFGEHGPIILTTPEIVARDKRESRETYTDIDVGAGGDITLSGTRETWTWQWDEFRFAAPIRDESGTWHIWWITAKKFSSGWAKTPIGVWVSGKAVKGGEIPESRFR